MAKVNHEQLSLNHGLYLSNMLMQDFYNEKSLSFQEVWEHYKEDILETISKPNKWTIIHWWLDFYNDLYEENDAVKKNTDAMEHFEWIKDLLFDTDYMPDIPSPNFDDDEKRCGAVFPCEEEDCDCCQRIITWENYLFENIEKVNRRVVHSAFQILYANRRFMRDFNMEFSYILEEDTELNARTDYFRDGKVKRNNYWPVWLKEAILYRDKGTCVNCKKDATGKYSVGQDVTIDHIVPLNLYGSNDATNFQLLCKTCNSSKGDRHSYTNSYNVPYWNLDKESLNGKTEGTE